MTITTKTGLSRDLPAPTSQRDWDDYWKSRDAELKRQAEEMKQRAEDAAGH